MAKFPITYSTTVPSGEVAQVPISAPMVDVRTGAAEAARAYARTGAQLSGLGKDLFQMGMKIQDQKDSLELSRRKRQLDEMGNAAYEAVKGDLEADAKLWEKFEMDSFGLYAEGGRVGVALEKYANEVMPQWQDAFDKHSIGVARKNVHDEYELESEKLLTQGNLVEYYTLLNNRLLLEDITQAEYDAKIEQAPNDSVLQQMRMAIGENRPQDAIEIAESLDEKTATPDQLQYRQKLIAQANKNIETSSPEASKQLTDLMAAGNLTLNEVHNRRNLLGAKDYQNWTKAVFNPIDKAGNVIKAAELSSRTIDVWRGTISRADVESEMLASLADPKGINDKEYAAIYADLDREVKGYQAQDRKAYSIEATQQILGKDAGALQFDTLGNMTIDVAKMTSPEAEFRRKLHFVTLYNKALDDFIAENPAVSKKDLWMKAQELKRTYTDASITGQQARYPARTYQKGDTKNINGTVFTFDGSRWND